MRAPYDAIDGEPRHVIHQSTAASFRALNARRAALGLVPVHPASSLASLVREGRSIEAAATRAWRRDHRLVAVPSGRGCATMEAAVKCNG